MPPRMSTRSASRPVAESRGGGTGERVGRGGRGRGPRGAQVGNQGNVGNQNGNVVNENVQEIVRIVLVNGNRIEKMESVQDMSGCSINQKVKYTAGSFVEEFCPSHEMQKLKTELWNHTMVGDGHAAYTDRNGLIKKVEKRGNVGEPSKDKNGRDDKKMTRTGNDFATTANPVGRENMGAWPKVVPRNVNPVNVRNLTPARGACHECGSNDHLKPACPRLNRAQGPGGNRPNQAVANNGGQGRGNQGNQAIEMLAGGALQCKDDSWEDCVVQLFTNRYNSGNGKFSVLPLTVSWMKDVINSIMD
ncbi:hypothetical protein Tco_1401111 [Tanacetum coccineum]